jgi:acyl carrier protein
VVFVTLREEGSTMDRVSLSKALLAMLENATGAPVPDLDESANLRQDLGLDSVDFVHVMIQIQSELQVELTPEDLEPVVVVRDLLDLIQAKMAAANKKSAA